MFHCWLTGRSYRLLICRAGAVFHCMLRVGTSRGVYTCAIIKHAVISESLAHSLRTVGKIWCEVSLRSVPPRVSCLDYFVQLHLRINTAITDEQKATISKQTQEKKVGCRRFTEQRCTSFKPSLVCSHYVNHPHTKLTSFSRNSSCRFAQQSAVWWVVTDEPAMSMLLPLLVPSPWSTLQQQSRAAPRLSM